MEKRQGGKRILCFSKMYNGRRPHDATVESHQTISDRSPRIVGVTSRSRKSDRQGCLRGGSSNFYWFDHRWDLGGYGECNSL